MARLGLHDSCSINGITPASSETVSLSLSLSPSAFSFCYACLRESIIGCTSSFAQVNGKEYHIPSNLTWDASAEEGRMYHRRVYSILLPVYCM